MTYHKSTYNIRIKMLVAINRVQVILSYLFVVRNSCIGTYDIYELLEIIWTTLYMVFSS